MKDTSSKFIRLGLLVLLWGILFNLEGRGDLVAFDFDPQAGHEQTGRRPAIVLSEADFKIVGNVNAESECMKAVLRNTRSILA
ncbi:type II toxin-antitoxin system PemK/MazF family toxin [Brevibacillus sp. B_LB10_24]|uniref:type II toxin-antitoxin system PemK/MazF family toxin n=1 Tax=Brevibacillus sp. B_LB10_24 TaxID=3380645 RepID=UPI0038B82E81